MSSEQKEETKEIKEFPLTDLSMQALDVYMKTLTLQTSLLKHGNMLLQVIVWSLYLVIFLLGLCAGAAIYISWQLS